ncbi:MAG: ribosome rescue protein RqcH [Ignisphaera sp.]
MSWLDLKIWLKEQKDLVEHSFIDNLYYIKEGSTLLLRMYNSVKGVTFWLIIEPSKRISLTFSDLKLDEIDEKAQRIWRTLLRDCYISGLNQIPCERILHIDVNCRDNVKKLIVELLPRGVVCIVDSQDKILLCNEYKSMRDRSVKAGSRYQPPPIITNCFENPSKILTHIQSNDTDVTRILIREGGLPPEIAETITFQCNLRDKKTSVLMEDEMACIDKVYHEIVTINKYYEPCIILDHQNNPIGFYSYSPPQFRTDNYRIEYYQTINEVINKYFEDSLKSLLLSSTSHRLKETINSTKNAIEGIDKLINEMKNELSELKSKIFVIDNNFLELEKMHQCIVSRVRTLGWEHIGDCGPIIEALPEKGVYKVRIDNLLLEFNVRKSFIENYNDIRKTIAGLEKSIAKAGEEKQKLATKLQELMKELELREAKIRYKLSRIKEWYEAYIWYISSSGFLVIGGKDSSQNIKIIRKLVEPHDIVMHADIHGASTIVIKSQKKNVDEETIREATTIAACYSKAWKLKLMNVDIFWVYGSQVSLSPPSGQYLPKGSFMVYGERNYIKNVELKLAVGIEIIDKGFRVIIGPEYIVDKRAIAYFVVIPGDKDVQLVAKEFIDYLKSSKYEQLAATLDISEIAKKLPGKSSIVRKVVKSDSVTLE